MVLPYQILEIKLSVSCCDTRHVRQQIYKVSNRCFYVRDPKPRTQKKQLPLNDKALGILHVHAAESRNVTNSKPFALYSIETTRSAETSNLLDFQLEDSRQT